MNLAIVGSRNFYDYNFLKEKLDKWAHKIDFVVSGGASGADSLAEKWAKEHNISIIIHRPKWEKYGKSAGYKRNELIVNDADVVVAFQKDKSKGTQHTIDIANKKNKPIKKFEL